MGAVGLGREKHLERVIVRSLEKRGKRKNEGLRFLRIAFLNLLLFLFLFAEVFASAEREHHNRAFSGFQLMVKTKQSRTGKVPGKKNGTSSQCLTDSPNCDDQIEDSDWIIVKKQRVTILVPAVPLNERSLTANKGPHHMHLMPPEIASNHVQLPKETSTNPSGNEHEKTTSLAVQREARAVRRASPPTLPKPIVVNPPSVDQRIESENLHQMNILKPHKLGISDTSKVKQTRTLHAPRMSPNLVTLNKNLRASNLQRKLDRAGGLNKWLASLGLEQFVSIFHGKSISKYQLVNLTMKKLKDMGASAVGPRRKLIHAMDCVCQPYCFQSL